LLSAHQEQEKNCYVGVGAGRLGRTPVSVACTPLRLPPNGHPHNRHPTGECGRSCWHGGRLAAVPVLQEEEAALIAGLVFAAETEPMRSRLPLDSLDELAS